MILWDVSSGTPLRRLRGHAARVTCVRYNEESTVAVSGSQDNSIMCWDVRSRNIRPIQVCVNIYLLLEMSVFNSELVENNKGCQNEN